MVLRLTKMCTKNRQATLSDESWMTDWRHAGKFCLAQVVVYLLSHVQLWASMDCSSSGSSVHGILQARILEWIAISFSGGDLPHSGIKPGSPAFQADSLPTESPVWKPKWFNDWAFKMGIFHIKIQNSGDFPGSPAVKTLCLQCRRCGFDFWLGN